MKMLMNAVGAGLCAMLSLAGSAAADAKTASPDLRIGILSDIHVLHRPGADVMEHHGVSRLRTCLRYLRDRQVDGVMICGDLANCGCDSELEAVARVWFEVFPDGRLPDGRPVANLMYYGNHDTAERWWKKSRDTWEKLAKEGGPTVRPLFEGDRRKTCWERCFREPWQPIQVKKVKGYTFVLAHYTYETPGWNEGLAETLAAANIPADKPFFYGQHSPLACTWHARWGADAGKNEKVLEKYPNCVAFSGDTHYMLTDDRNVWQRKFTAVHAGAIRSQAPDRGHENGVLIPWAKADRERDLDMPCIVDDGISGGLVMNVYGDRIVLERLSMKDAKPLGPDLVFSVDIPARTCGEDASVAAASACPTPVFPASAKVGVSRVNAVSRRKRPYEAVQVEFPTAKSVAGHPRATDYRVRAFAADGQLLKEHLVYSPGINRPESDDPGPVRCQFDGKDLGKGALKFVVEPRNCWGATGPGLVVSFAAAAAASAAEPAETGKPRVREMVADRRYALFPMWNCGPGELRHKVTLSVDGVPKRIMDLLLPQKDPDWWASMDVSAYRGKTLRFEMADVPAGEYDQLQRIELSDDPRLPPGLHDEAYRPQLKFTADRGWINDPNGLVYQNGKWRLFYQHNPYSVWWGNLHWGYAESTDLVHWTDRGAALFPEAPLQNIISGSGIVDVDDTAGFGKGAHIVLVQHGPGLCVWTAPDGEHYEYWKGNPIARGIRGADPKVVWYAKDRRWICLTHGREHDVYTVFINSSPNLREWREESKFYGDHVSKGRGQYMHECPGLEELRIRGEEGTGWILWGANAVSAIGSFDGHVFSPERERVPTYQKDADEKGWPWYAAQAFQNAPDGRTVLVPWLRTTIIGFEKRSAFNQAMGIPQELELVRTPEGLRLSRLPVKEMDSLRAGPAVPFERFRGELAEVHVTCEPGPDAELAFDFRGVPMTWSSRTQMLTMEAHRRAPRTSVRWPTDNGRLAFRLYLDRVAFEAFSPDGLLSAPFCRAFPDAKSDRISVKAKGAVRNLVCSAYPLRSIYSDGTASAGGVK